MSDAPVSINTRDGVRTITVQRPEKLNALNRQTLEALDAAFADAATAADVRVVVLTGAGPKAFVAGADIAEMNGLSAVQGRDFSLLGQRLMRRIERLPRPVIAMVNGFALGGGLELAMACHLRIAADSARLGQPEINLGLIPGFGGTQRLLRLAGRAATLELCLLGAPIDAAPRHEVPAQRLDGAGLAGEPRIEWRLLEGGAALGGAGDLPEDVVVDVDLLDVRATTRGDETAGGLLDRGDEMRVAVVAAAAR